jgi:hypothetical protein
MVRFTITTAVLVSLVATSSAFQPVGRATLSPRTPSLRVAFIAEEMVAVPTAPVTQPPPQKDKKEPYKMDMTGIVLSVSAKISMKTSEEVENTEKAAPRVHTPICSFDFFLSFLYTLCIVLGSSRQGSYPKP